MNSYMSPRLMMGAAIVGLVGAAGVFIYEQLYAEKRRAMLVREVARLDKQLASMRSDLESLRELQKETLISRQSDVRVSSIRAGGTMSSNMRRPRPKPRVRREAAPAGDATDSEYFTDCQSLIGTDIDMDSEEFYDVPSDEDDTLRESVRNGYINNKKLDQDDLESTNDASKST